MKKSISLLLAACMLCAVFTGCQASMPEVKSDSLYVEKVENLSEDFIMGMDASCVPALEASGVKYYDYDGNEQDVYRTLHENGINYIRVRVWVDPYDSKGNGYGGGNCDIANCVEIGKRATENNMKLLVDFHYSDFWADPSKQMVPKAWKSMDIDQKTEAVFNHTADCLNQLKEAGVDVGMVQVGNETNGALCGEKIWMNIYKLMDAGSRATRQIYPEAMVAVHFANPEKAGSYDTYAKKLDYYSLDYDVFASSYYPFWHGTLDNLATTLSTIAEKYNKKVMVAETSYAYTAEDSDMSGNTISSGSGIVKDYPFTIQGQANSVRNTIDTIVNKMTNGIGIFYWEGTWISVGNDYEANSALWEKYGSGWASSYSSNYDPEDAGKHYGGNAVDNQALFDSQGRPLESLKVFSLVREGNAIAPAADAIDDTNLILDLNGDIVLPTEVNAVMSDNTRQAIEVEWLDADIEAMRNGGINKYEITGTAGGMTAKAYVSMVSYNFLQNYSFEDGDAGWTATPLKPMDELYVEEKSTDSVTGAKHYHFWSAENNSVEFTLEQPVKDLPEGHYRYEISMMGGDAGDTVAYAYVKINGEIAAKADMIIDGYNNWHAGVIDDIAYNGTDEFAVGIYVSCSGEGNGAWGKIDDALLNSLAS